MATVVRFKEKPGQMFGGKGAAVFRPFDRSKPAPKAADSQQEYPLATEVEFAIYRIQELHQNSSDESKDRDL